VPQNDAGSHGLTLHDRVLHDKKGKVKARGRSQEILHILSGIQNSISQIQGLYK
jgi:hypothetical protein